MSVQATGIYSSRRQGSLQPTSFFASAVKSNKPTRSKNLFKHLRSLGEEGQHTLMTPTIIAQQRKKESGRALPQNLDSFSNIRHTDQQRQKIFVCLTDRRKVASSFKSTSPNTFAASEGGRSSSGNVWYIGPRSHELFQFSPDRFLLMMIPLERLLPLTRYVFTFLFCLGSMKVAWHCSRGFCWGCDFGCDATSCFDKVDLIR